MPTKKNTKSQKKISFITDKASRVYMATSGNVLCIPEDTIRRVLHEQCETLSKNSIWISLVCQTAAFIVVLLTSSFHEYLSISADSIKGAYIVVCLFFVAWTFVECKKAWNNRSRNPIDEIISSLKEQSQQK